MIANTIDEVIEMLEQIIQQSKATSSPLGYFAALYQKVTIGVKERLQTNYFDDDERMERLDVLFANRYLEAYAAYKNGEKITQSWRVTFEMAENANLIVLQHLLLGMNAHINLDLGIAAATISKETSIKDLEGDFNKINEILAELVEEVQDRLAQIWPMLLKLLKFTKKADDLLVNFSMELARNGAWKFANEVHQEKNLNRQNERIMDRDKKVVKVTDVVTKHGLIGRIIFTIIRFGERGRVVDKINILQQINTNKA